jgi:hypothetical protein
MRLHLDLDFSASKGNCIVNPLFSQWIGRAPQAKACSWNFPDLILRKSIASSQKNLFQKNDVRIFISYLEFFPDSANQEISITCIFALLTRFGHSRSLTIRSKKSEPPEGRPAGRQTGQPNNGIKSRWYWTVAPTGLCQ